MSAQPSQRQSSWRIFRWPLSMALVNAVGLVAALIGNDGWDVLSWATLAFTLVVIVAAWRGWSAS